MNIDFCLTSFKHTGLLNLYLEKNQVGSISNLNKIILVLFGFSNFHKGLCSRQAEQHDFSPKQINLSKCVVFRIAEYSAITVKNYRPSLGNLYESFLIKIILFLFKNCDFFILFLLL